jgi:hypothetical protein
MIWAGRTFLIEKTGYTKEILNSMPYPEFKAMIDFYGDPEKFLEPSKPDEVTVKNRLADYQRRNQEMMRKSREKAG